MCDDNFVTTLQGPSTTFDRIVTAAKIFSTRAELPEAVTAALQADPVANDVLGLEMEGRSNRSPGREGEN